MPTRQAGSRRAMSPQAMCARSRPSSVTPAVSPIKVQAGTSTFNGMIRARNGIAAAGRAAQRVGQHHHDAAIDDLERGEELDGGLRDVALGWKRTGWNRIIG